ncbi:hypothetical protein BDQ12DRAFT_690024 [Crucibulum laeve]|uniref:Uncharacterized protein n=1 Tax=Crucibulum laeve TaxID=68775 RepID=A0A5C3LN63_9AGAR|nr:hypothetical protein BDQ12DRAFT_690024 [Crucibulum laeve]
MGDVETSSSLFLGPSAQARSNLADARANLARRPTSLAVPRRRCRTRHWLRVGIYVYTAPIKPVYL